MKLDPQNAEKVQAALEAVQGKAHTRLLTAGEIRLAAEQAEARLELLGLPKNRRAGATAVYEPHTVAKAYGFPPEGTQATLERFPVGWRVTSVTRDHIANSAHDLYVTLPVKAGTERDVLDAVMATHGIRRAAKTD